MRTVGLFEAKQKLSEIVKCASEGERIGITRRGKLAALVIPAQPETGLEKFFTTLNKFDNESSAGKKSASRT
jgi:prevent-host-death family protein